MHRFFILSFVIATIFGQPTTAVLAQEALENRVTINSEMRDFARSRWQRTDVEVLRPGEELLGSRRADAKPRAAPTSVSTNRDTTRTFAIIILIAIICVGIYLLVTNQMGGGLLAKRVEETPLDVEGAEVGGLDVSASNSFSLDALAHSQDTHQALRLLLVNVLARAASANDIPLRRSLTARDIVRRLPQNWSARKNVADLVAVAEPILFGGRALERVHLDELIKRVQPVFGDRGGAR